MSIKKLNEFNNTYVEFVNQLSKTYSFVKELHPSELLYNPIEEESAPVEKVEESTEGETETAEYNFTDEQLEYLMHYMQHVFPHIKYIARCDEEWFQDDAEDAEIVRGVKMNAILNDDATTTKQMNRVWEYLHTLYIKAQATKLTVRLLKERFADHPQYKQIKKSILRYADYLTLMVEFLSQQRNEATAEEAEDDTEDDAEEEEAGEKDTSGEGAATGTGSGSASTGGGFFDNTLIGNLAKEISEEVDTSHLENLNSEQDIFSNLFSGEGGSNMMGMMKTVCEKLDSKVKSGELNPQQMLSELGGSLMGPMMENMMGGMNLPGMPGNRQQRRRAKRKAKKMAKKGNKSSSK